MNRFGERSARRELLCEPQVEGIEHHRTSEHRGGRPGYKATKNSVSADWRIGSLCASLPTRSSWWPCSLACLLYVHSSDDARFPRPAARIATPFSRSALRIDSYG